MFHVSTDCKVIGEICLIVIASVGRQNDVYRPIQIQKSYRPTVFFNAIAA